MVVAACSPAADGGLTVFAAASLRDVAADLEAAWSEDHPDQPLTIANEASNVLATQISEGAPADVFISADPSRAWLLADDGLTAGEPRPFAQNRVALVAPLEGTRVTRPADLAEPGVAIISTSPSAPITGYAAEALAHLAATMPEPERFIRAVEANVVSREDNVRAALAKVELGEGDAAFVYDTDIQTADGVRQIPLPGQAQVTARYVVVQVSPEPAAAAFVDWLRSDDAVGIIEAAGFEVVP